MDSLLLQDWVTVSNGGAGNQSAVAQGAPGYLDVSEYEDLVFYLHIATPISPSIPPTPNIPLISYQTAPSAEDSAFLTMFQLPNSFLGGGTRADVVLGRYALVPPAKYVRWICSGTGYICTFRIWVAGFRLP